MSWDCHVTWRRRARLHDERRTRYETTRGEARDARWLHVKGGHLLSFQDGEALYVVRMERDRVLMVRRGEVSLTQIFAEGKSQDLVLRAHGKELPVRAETRSVEVSVGEAGGRAHVTFDLVYADQEAQFVDLVFQWVRRS
ncbi:Uncharacterized beta-barrel protein YwiB, DUF1934 family [Alicyclobacillus vulcanalis]|uniref:Uncharacterized beta-barrel protein YwiB, DUF1934 family n=1 Tax=Alicyclobacillus vulcanalis TaxID=252246 RepID=A0A1N7LH32_9BACL|nr:Uncharacterized beta-barrel protein YwiB, DUF1934 family [Alicyclobacillus vulcanalis]